MSDAFNDPFKMMRDFWKPLEGALPPGMAPPLSLAEIDRKLAELRTVEQWLAMNIGMLQMNIKALDMQRAGLAAMQAASPPPAG